MCLGVDAFLLYRAIDNLQFEFLDKRHSLWYSLNESAPKTASNFFPSLLHSCRCFLGLL